LEPLIPNFGEAQPETQIFAILQFDLRSESDIQLQSKKSKVILSFEPLEKQEEPHNAKETI